jgi:O-antigen ligase
MLAKYYPRALAIAAVLIFFTNLDGYLFSSEKLASVPPLYWILVYLVLATPLLFNRKLFASVQRSPLIYWCYGFLLISGIWLFFQSAHSEIVWQEFRLRLLSVLFLLCLLVVLSKEDAQQWARRALLIAVLVGVTLNFYELFHPAAFGPIVGRSAGFYMNPNQSGTALVLGLIFCIGILNQRFRVLLTLIVLAGVVLTFSRAAIAGYLIVVLALVLGGVISLRKSLLIGVIGLSALFVPLLVWWDELLLKLRELGVLNQNVLQRVDWFTNPKGDSDESSIARYDVIREAWRMFTDRPIIGHGLATTKDWSYAVSSHNQYLNLMVDHGILGAFILPLLVLAVTWGASGEARKTGLTFAAFTLFIGFFSHNLLDERYFLIMFSLMTAMVVTSKMKTGETQADHMTSYR